VHLPTVSGGSFHFTIGNVGPNSVTFIDPPVAVGYDYATGPGDPNFKSVPNEVTAVLPATGEYLAVVGEQPLIAQRNRFRGEYCLSVQSSAGAAQTLQPTDWVE
jgi:hypothetical protein